MTPFPLAADDLALLRCFQRTRDEAAFAELLRRHWPMVIGVCRRRLACGFADTSDADDDAQTVFLLLARKAFWFRREVVLSGWLHRAALHTCRTLQRARLRQLHRDTEAARRATLDASPVSTSPAHLPSELTSRLDDALDALPHRLRAAVVLCHLEGFSRREAGVLLGCGENTVSKRLARAIPRLRAALEKRGVSLSSVALLAALQQATTDTSAATAPASVIAAAGGQLGHLSGLAALLAALTAWWPASALLLTATLAAIGFLKAGPHRPDPVENVPALISPAHAASAPIIAAPTLGSSMAKLAPPSVALGKLSRLSISDFEKLIEQLILTKATPEEIVTRFEERLGLAITLDEARELMKSSKTFYLGALQLLGFRQPRETLVWIAGMSAREAGSATKFINVIRSILAREAWDEAALAGFLPQGLGSETIYSTLRLQTDAPSEATRRLANAPDPQTRRQYLQALAETWPEGREADAFGWAAQRLHGEELARFLSGVVYGLSQRDADATLVLLEGLSGTDALAPVLQRALRGLVEQNRKIAEVLPLVESLSGKKRASTISELARRWVRVDEDGLLEWIAARPVADQTAALPLTLSQLQADNYERMLAALLPSRDPAIEAALIRSAMPGLGKANRRSADLVEKLMTRPGLETLSANAAGNAALLWRAVETNAKNWVAQDGDDPRAAAAWVDRLRFSTLGDKTRIVRLVYDQWKASDGPAADDWARAAGLATDTPGTK